MARLYKRGRVWWTWVYLDGQQVRRSTGCTDKAAATRVAHQWERDAADPAYVATHTTLEMALEMMAKDRRARGCADGTIHMYRVKSGHLVRVIGNDTPLSHITARVVDDYTYRRLDEGASRSTIGKELTTLRVALKVAARRGEWSGSVDAVMPDRWAVNYEPRRTALSHWDALALIQALEPHRSQHAAFLLATGMRWGESLRALPGDVDGRQWLVRVRGTKTDAAAATVPIVGPARYFLAWGAKGLPFPAWGNVRRDLAAACARAGIPAVTPNDLRRTHATWLRMAGVEPSLIAGVLRHRDSRMVERVYGRVDPRTLGRLIKERMR